MPYLKLNTNIETTADQSEQLLKKLSDLMVRETGKPERYVMTEVATGKLMMFSGSQEPLVYLECKSIGLSSTQAKSIAKSVADLLNSNLQIAADRIYIEFSDCPASFWGWNGSTFG